MWASYEQWQRLGRHVKKGERSVLRDPQSIPLFKFEQTEKTPQYKVIWEEE